MSMVFRSIHVLMLYLILSALAACGSDTDDGNGDDADAGPGGDGSVAEADAGPSSHLSAEALQELQDVGLDEFLGLAVVTDETTQGNVTSFTFDQASGPICMAGAEFHAHIRDTGSDSLVFLLDGGGACWSELCSASADADTTMVSYGLTDDTNDENVAKDWNVVYVPYCDGSVYSGANNYELENGSIRYHHGRQNLSAGVDLALEYFPDMKRIIVTGVSAGGYGTIPATGLVRMAFPQAELFVINDSGPGLQDTEDTASVESRIEEWRHNEVTPPSCVECDEGRGQYTEMITWGLENDAALKTALVSSYEDMVIGGFFLGLAGPDYKAILLQETDKIRERFPDRFKRFLVAGNGHGIMVNYYGAEIEGVTYAQWVRAMVEGDDTIWRDLLAP